MKSPTTTRRAAKALLVVNERTVLSAQTTTLRDLLREIADIAMEARELDVRGDNLPDRIDDIDNELQKVIEIVKNIREVR